MDYYSTGPKNAEHLRSVSSVSIPYSPISQATGTNDAMAPYFNSSMDNFHCCYTSAYSILDTLRHVRHTHPAFTKGPFEAVLLTSQSAIRNVLELLNCPCSSDPHLAMLYSDLVPDCRWCTPSCPIQYLGISIVLLEQQPFITLFAACFSNSICAEHH